MKALKNHFAGEDNATVIFFETEWISDFLCYNNERSMEFELFLTKRQKMYTTFK